MTSLRLSAAAALATICASLSLFAVVQGPGWLIDGIGLVIVMALAGALTRAATITAAAGATCAVLIAAMPLLVGYGWGGRIGWLVLVALTAVSATGNRAARGFAMLATYCSFLLIYLNIVFTGAASYARLIPSPASVSSLAHLPSAATAQFSYAPPIPPSRPVDMLAVAGIGAIAAIVDFIAVRLRRPALAGLPLLLLFSVPVASDLKGFGFDQTIAFGLAIATYLMLLSTDGRQRLRMWGRLVTVRRITGDEGGGPDTRDLAATGRRIGLAAICLAIVVPIALPSGKPHDLFSKDNDGQGTAGTSGSGGVSPLLNVIGFLTEGKPTRMLSYTSSLNGLGQEPYLQESVLNYQASTDSWLPPAPGRVSVVQAGRPMDQVPGFANGTTVTPVTTKLVIDDQKVSFAVPLPYAPVMITHTNASELQELAGTLTVFDRDDQAPLRLTVTSDDVQPDSADFNFSSTEPVPASIQSSYGTYKGPDARQLRAIADSVIGGSSSWLDDAVLLQRWLTSARFTYTIRPHLSGKNWLLTFLRSERAGFCQQFAWAFAVLARTLGIPSRIAVGWTAGTEGKNHVWTVTSKDAHAWPELFFPEIGWVRFEPTPGGANGQGTATTPSYATGNPSSRPSPTATQSAGVPNSSPSAAAGTTSSSKSSCHVIGPAQARLGPCTHADTGGAAAAARSQGFPVGIVVAIVIVLLLASPAVGRWLTRRRRWLAASDDATLALAAWRELDDILTDYRVTTLPSDSPRTTVTRISAAARLAPAPHDALARIATAVERARYSLHTQPGSRLRADVAMVRKAIAARSSRGQRLRALLLPPSTMAAVNRALQSAGRATTWIDSSWPSMRRQFRAVLHRAG